MAVVRRVGHPAVSATFDTKSAAQAWALGIESDAARALRGQERGRGDDAGLHQPADVRAALGSKIDKPHHEQVMGYVK